MAAIDIINTNVEDTIKRYRRAAKRLNTIADEEGVSVPMPRDIENYVKLTEQVAGALFVQYHAKSNGGDLKRLLAKIDHEVVRAAHEEDTSKGYLEFLVLTTAHIRVGIEDNA